MARQLRDLDANDWRRMLAGRTRLQQVQVILRQLAGYRITSLHMSQDEDRLVVAIDTILSLVFSEERAQDGRVQWLASALPHCFLTSVRWFTRRSPGCARRGERRVPITTAR